MRALVAIAPLALSLAGPAAAQISTTATPMHHGKLLIGPATGVIDRTASAGTSTLRINGWKLRLADGSNGIYPDREPIVVALGENNFRLEALSLQPRRHGKIFRYRAPDSPGARGIRFMKIVVESARSYRVTLTLAGLELSDLITNDPWCYPMAVIVGDDDGFSGVNVARVRPVFKSRRLFVLQKPCPPAGGWPWA